MSRARREVNEDVKYYMRMKNVSQWELAEACGVSESYFSRRFGRYEQADFIKKDMLAIIDDIARNREAGES